MTQVIGKGLMTSFIGHNTYVIGEMIKVKGHRTDKGWTIEWTNEQINQQMNKKKNKEIDNLGTI